MRPGNAQTFSSILRKKRLRTWAALFFLFFSAHCPAQAGPYIEAGTSLGSMKSGDSYFGKSDASSRGLAFIGSMSIYFTTPTLLAVSHFDIGLQNRLSLGGGGPGVQLTMLTPSLAARYEFWRFFVGGGYAPITFGGTSGLTSLVVKPGGSSYFFEGGLIWRIVPEFQICAAVGLEYGRISGVGSPTNTEYGLRFRFPFSPKEDSASKGVKWDGFRYPFGVMKD